MVHVKRTGQIDTDDLVPVRRNGFDKQPEDIPAGVVYEHVDRPKCCFGVANGVLTIDVLGDVAGEGLGLAAGFGDGGRRVQSRGPIHVKDRDFGTFFSKSSAGRGTDSAAAARDDHDLVLQPDALPDPCALEDMTMLCYICSCDGETVSPSPQSNSQTSAVS